MRMIMPKVKIYTIFKSTDIKFILNEKEIVEHFGINYDIFLWQHKTKI